MQYKRVGLELGLGRGCFASGWWEFYRPEEVRVVLNFEYVQQGWHFPEESLLVETREMNA